MSRMPFSLWPMLAALAVCMSARADAPPPLVVLGPAQVTDVLYETVNWYRLIGSQRPAAGQAGDALILYANRQIATQVVHLSLDMARADAELLSSQASQAVSAPGVGSSANNLNSQRQQLDAQARQIEGELQAARSTSASVNAQRGYLGAKVSELEGELAMVNARSNLLAAMAQFVNGTDSRDSGANALKEHVAAIEASLPKAGSGADTAVSPLSTTPAARRLGIWDLTANALDLANRIGTIRSMDDSTVHLETAFKKLSATPVAAITALSSRSDALSAQADHADSATMKTVRAQLDTVAWQFKQTSAVVLPLGQAQVLLEQYRHNLSNWHEMLQRQERATLNGLAVRIGILVLLLVVLFAGAELWRRAVVRFEHEPRRRNQWLLVRRVTLWTAVAIVVGFTFVSELSSIATFAGLITAGLAVAMQSVLVSVVGYFFLIGKYGLRVGDRVQVGSVTGEVVELGLVRMHLLELGTDSNNSPTGRIVAIANSVVFQSSGGLFRQIPGVNFAWHDLTLALPAGIDYAAAKEALRAAVAGVVQQYRENMVYETGQLQEVLEARGSGNATSPRVQLHFSASGVEAHVWYPVYLPRTAEIDERVSQELLKVINAAESSSARKLPATSTTDAAAGE